MRYLLIILFLAICTQVQASSYDQILKQITQERKELRRNYHKAKKNKTLILSQAGQSLNTMVTNKISPYWIGTPWSFNGTSSKPKSGSIACGYFVTTVLEHAGFKLNRYRLAQMASETMILRFTKRVKRYRQVDFKKFLASIKKWGIGLYVVGLDNHTGFIQYDGKHIYFIHSAFAWPFTVQKQLAKKSSILEVSEYRVLGRLDNDKSLIKKWLLGLPI